MHHDDFMTAAEVAAEPRIHPVTVQMRRRELMASAKESVPV
jgi:hypothetical protein